MNRVNVGRGFRVLYSKSATLFGLGFLALFAQLASAQGSLNYFQNYFVTGDYVVGGVGLYGKGANPTATINFSGVPCTSGPGLFAGVVPCSTKGAVPADIIAAFLYWETIEPTSSASPTAIAGTFDGASNTIAGLPLGNPQIAACVVGGGTQSNSSYARVYRADVLRFLAINSTANVRTANYAHTITFSGNPAGTQFNGATLVVVYRLVTPGNPRIAPLRSVVIYDGAFTGVASAKSPSLNLTMGGFYQASANDNARMTHIVGGGEPNFRETLTVNGNIPQGVDSSPFEGAQGPNWDNFTFNYNLPSNASSVQTAVQSTKDCLSWAAIITSTNVQDSDLDGLLDVWETSGMYRNPGVRNDDSPTAPVPATFGTCAQYPHDSANCVNLPAMGANPYVPDIFVQVDWMQYQKSLLSAAGGSPTVPDHIHNPQLAALNMVGSMFKSHGINLHFDAGSSSTYQGQGSPYVIPAAYAQGGNVVQESSVLCLPSNNNNILCEFTPQTQEYSVLGWKIGFTAIRDGDTDFPTPDGKGLPQLFARNRLYTFHYSLFGHAIAATTPLSAPAAGSISGVGDLPGGDFMVTLGLWRSDTPSVDQVGTLLDQAGTLGHELGHNLGLGHGGWTDTPVCKPDYPSIMNYLYQVNGLTDAAGNEHLDYSYGLLLPLIENNLSVKIPMGIQAYRVRYFGPLNSIAGSPLANTPGQASKVYCNGNLLNGSEGPYVRLEWPTVSTPDWSNGTVKLGSTLPPLFINYDGIPGETFTDSPDWISLNLQQVGARPNVDGVSLDLGRSDLGRSDLGRSDLGRSDLGRSDLGRSDLGTAALGQDALGDEDYATYSLSGVPSPINLTAAVTTTAPPFPNPNPGGTGVLLNWMPALGAAYDHYNIYRCNASAGACTPTAGPSPGTPATPITTVQGGVPNPTYTDYVNDFVHAGATCPATSTCYNTPFTYSVTGVVVVGNLSSESGPPIATTSSQVNHLFVIANAQTVQYGATALPFTTPLPNGSSGTAGTYTVYGNGSLPTSGAGAPSCVYSSPPRNVGNYPITCSGPATSTGTTGVTYNAAYLVNTPGSLNITQRPITVMAASSSKNYDGTMNSTAIPTITVGSLAPGYGDALAFTESYDNKNVGTTHVMTPAGIVNDTNSGNNYAVTLAPSAATSVIKAVQLTIAAVPSTKPYDTTTSSAATPTVTGLQTGDSLNPLAETYANKNAGPETLAVTTYTINDGNNGNNYSPVTLTTAAGTITQAPVSATIAASNKPYDTTTTALITGCTVVGVLTPDVVTCSASGAAFAFPSAGTWPVAATITLGGGASSNYVLPPPSMASTSAMISQLGITASVTTSDKDFDGTNTATITSCTPNGVLPPDVVTCTAGPATFSSIGPGNGLAVTATGVTLTQPPAMNYVLTPTTATGTASIFDTIDLTALTLNGSPGLPTLLSGPTLRLTNNTNETVSAWLGNPIPVASGFRTTFTFQITPGENGPNSIGDGFAFVIQNAGNNPLGTTGAGANLGYLGISKSIAIEFDTYYNSDFGDPAPTTNTPSGSHIAIQSLGTSANSSVHNGSPTNATLGGPTLFNFADGNPHTATITYDGTTLSVFVDPMTNPTAVVTAAVSVDSLLGLSSGPAYPGFTAATGAAQEFSDILGWTWN